jgi:hypothetical protein
MLNWLRKVKAFFFPEGGFYANMMAGFAQGQVKGNEMRKEKEKRRRLKEYGKRRDS